MLAALITDKLRPGLIMFSAVVLMLAVGILTPKEAIEGFSNKGMITVALLYLISEGVRNSGMLERLRCAQGQFPFPSRYLFLVGIFE